jgi:ribose/xylose/arabinose/galactoside ABC-type transport system permease subunit
MEHETDMDGASQATATQDTQFSRGAAAAAGAWRILRTNGIVLAFLVLLVAGSLRSEHFLTVDNFANVARQASIAGILGIGMTFVILTAGIDLSVGSILGIVGMWFV